MEELYWIGRLDGIFAVFLILSLLSAGCLIFSYIIPWGEEYSNDYCKEKGIFKVRKISSLLLPISVLIAILLPSSREMSRIIIIGGTIDYINQNDTTKQIPDKCLKALDLFLDKAIKKDDDKKIRK